MRLKSFKGLSLGKMKEKEAESGIVIEATTAEQLAEMQKRMDGRKKELENATKQLQGLSAPHKTEEEEEEAIGPHGPILELTLEDIPDDDDLFIPPLVDDEEAETEAPKLQEMTLAAKESETAKESDLEDLMQLSEEVEDDAEEEEKNDDGDGLDLSDSFGSLFDENESDENQLANLINNLPDVSAQELLDDIEEIKQIIKEWQQHR